MDRKLFHLAFAPLLISASALLLHPSIAKAVPVYLSPDSDYASGHYSRGWLESQTTLQSSHRWIKVRANSGTVGWVRESQVVARTADTVLSKRPHLTLHKASVPYSDIVLRLDRLEPLRVLSTRNELWGRVLLRDRGEVWWPINNRDEGHFFASNRQLKLKTSELFKRTIYDMASSPTRANLKFASASGIFRTTDGREWTRLVFFHDHNHPIAVSATGRIFIGPYVSDDDGETFREYIRWDNLVQTIREKQKPSVPNVRILEVKPGSVGGSRVELRLDIGHDAQISVGSDDLGQNWKTL